jgi:hypothetical protein
MMEDVISIVLEEDGLTLLKPSILNLPYSLTVILFSNTISTSAVI